jgi:hypothetical protein
MTDRETQKKIARLLGWKPKYDGYDDHIGSFTEGFPPGSGLFDAWVEFPDWLNDPTACVQDFKMTALTIAEVLRQANEQRYQDFADGGHKGEPPDLQWFITSSEFAKILCAAFIGGVQEIEKRLKEKSEYVAKLHRRLSSLRGIITRMKNAEKKR